MMYSRPDARARAQASYRPSGRIWMMPGATYRLHEQYVCHADLHALCHIPMQFRILLPLVEVLAMYCVKRRSISATV